MPSIEGSTDSESGPFSAGFRAQHAPEVDGYRVLSVLGSGGHSTVYLAEDDAGRHVALKSWRAVGWSEEARGRVAREAGALRDLDHPNIARFLALKTGRDGQPCVVMEAVQGSTLAEVVREEGPLDAGRVTEVALTLTSAMQFLVDHDMVHRDIKPANVVLRAKDGVPILVDFSIVKRGGELRDETITREGAAIGTSAYMAPEQCAGDLGPVDARTDVYGLGALLFQLVTGLPPWTQESGWERKQRNPWRSPYPTQPEQREQVLAARERIPSGLGDVIARCLEGDPARRFAGPKQVAQALLDRRPSRWPIVLGAGLILTVIAGLVGTWNSSDHPDGLDPIPEQRPVASVESATNPRKEPPMPAATRNRTAVRISEPNFLPLLKPRDWRGYRQGFALKLIPDDDPRVPLVTFGWDELDRITFLGRDDIKQAGLEGPVVRKAALKNLSRYLRREGFKWEVQDFPLGNGKARVAMLEGEHAASCILLPSFLKQAHKKLRSDQLIVGIPHDGALWACEIGLAPMMRSLASDQFDEAVEQGLGPITPAMIVVRNGKPVGIVVPRDDTPHKTTRKEDDEVTWKRAAYKPQADGSLLVPVECRDLEEVRRAVLYEMDAIHGNLDSIREEFPGFKNRVHFAISRNSALPTANTKQALKELTKLINGVAERNGLPLRVTVRLAR